MPARFSVRLDKPSRRPVFIEFEEMEYNPPESRRVEAIRPPPPKPQPKEEVVVSRSTGGARGGASAPRQELPSSNRIPDYARKYEPPPMGTAQVRRRPIPDMSRDIPTPAGPDITTRHRGDYELPPSSPQRVERPTGQFGGGGVGPPIGLPTSPLHDLSKGGGVTGGGEGAKGRGGAGSSGLGGGIGQGGGGRGNVRGLGDGDYELLGTLKFSDFSPGSSLAKALADIVMIEGRLSNLNAQDYVTDQMKVALKPEGMYGLQAELPEGLAFILKYNRNKRILEEIVILAKPGVTKPRDYDNKIIATVRVIAKSLR